MKIVARLCLSMAFLAVLGTASLLANDPAVEERIQQLEAQIAAQQAMLEELKAVVKTQGQGAQEDTAKVVRDTVAKELDAFKGVRDLRIGGDIRVRYESFFFEDSAIDQRNRYRMRFRFNLSKQFKYGVAGHVQLASGSARVRDNVDLGSEPTSTNQTFDRSFEQKPFWLDQAYITWTPEGQNIFTFGGGKFKNPFMTSWAIWDTDVNPEGFYQTVKFKADALEVFGTFGQMIIRENSSRADSYLLAGQGGVGYSGKTAGFKAAVAYWDYRNYARSGNWVYQNGNTRLANGNLTAGDFNVIDGIAVVNIKTKTPIEFMFNYSKNLDDATVTDLANNVKADQDTAWFVGGKIGNARNQGNWEASAYYAHIEANAVPGAFTDSDFGFNNRKGFRLGFAYAIYNNLQFSSSFYRTDRIEFANKTARNTLHLDLSFRF